MNEVTAGNTGITYADFARMPSSHFDSSWPINPLLIVFVVLHVEPDELKAFLESTGLGDAIEWREFHAIAYLATGHVEALREKGVDRAELLREIEADTHPAIFSEWKRMVRKFREKNPSRIVWHNEGVI